MKKILLFFVLMCVLSLQVNAKQLIYDDFVNLTLKGYAEKTTQKKETDIEDEFLDSSFYKSYANSKKDKYKPQSLIEDSFVAAALPYLNLEKPAPKFHANFENYKKYPIKIHTPEYITTKNKKLQGQKLRFYTMEETYLPDGQILPVNTEINAKVEMVSQNNVWGVPADMIVNNFTLELASKRSKKVVHNLEGRIEKTGANRSYWVYPIVEASCWTVFCAGAVVIPIRGGHAKIKPGEVHTVYYQP